MTHDTFKFSIDGPDWPVVLELAWSAYKVKTFWQVADSHPLGGFEAVGQLARQNCLLDTGAKLSRVAITVGVN